MKKILVQNCTVGMYLENVGKIDKVEILPDHVALTIVGGVVLSAAFYWYIKGTYVFVRENTAL